METAVTAILVVGTFVAVYWLLASRAPRPRREPKDGFLRRARRLVLIAIERAGHRDVHWLIARERERHL
jgi:hypothetical protein